MWKDLWEKAKRVGGWLLDMVLAAWRHFVMEAKEKKANLESMTLSDVKDVVKKEATQLFMGGVAAFGRKRLGNPPVFNALRIRYEDSFVSDGFRPLTTLAEGFKSLCKRVWTGAYVAPSPILFNVA